MSLTTLIIVNAVLDVLVVGALLRLMWFGISKPYDEPGELRHRVELRRLELRRIAEHKRRAA